MVVLKPAVHNRVFTLVTDAILYLSAARANQNRDVFRFEDIIDVAYLMDDDSFVTSEGSITFSVTALVRYSYNPVVILQFDHADSSQQG